MKRRFIALLAALPLLAACASPAGENSEAVAYPANCRSVDIIAGISAGGTTDLAFRILADELTKETGREFRVVNTPGGGGVTGIKKLLAAKKDGCTFGNSALPSHLQYLFPESKADYTKEDFALVAAVGSGSQALVVRADSDYESLDDLIAAGKKKGRLNAASDGPKGGDAIVNAQFAKAGGIEIRQVIVDGSAEKVTTLLSGQVDFFSGSIGGVTSGIASGQLRALATWSDKRSELLPDVPTAREQQIDVVSDATVGVTMPAGVPEQTRQALEADIKSVSGKESFIKAIAKLGLATEFRTGEEYSRIWDDSVRTVQSLDLDGLNK